LLYELKGKGREGKGREEDDSEDRAQKSTRVEIVDTRIWPKISHVWVD
jgi:hypothetical protein